MTSASGPAIDPHLLEQMRRGVPLLMNALGDLMFDDEPITHPRLQQALRNGLDQSDEGETIVRLGSQWCYLTVADCPLRATRVTRPAKTNTLHVKLDDGRELPVEVHTLWDEPKRGLRLSVPSQSSGRPLAVRFTNQAQMDLSDWLEPGEDNTTVLVLGETRYPIPQVPPQYA